MLNWTFTYNHKERELPGNDVIIMSAPNIHELRRMLVSWEGEDIDDKAKLKNQYTSSFMSFSSRFAISSLT